MDPERTQRLMWLLAALGFAMAILGAVGEIAGRAEPVSRAAEAMGLGQMLGWWNDVGQLLMGTGTLLGVVMSSSSLLLGSSRDQARALDEGQARTHQALGSMDGKLDSMDGKLDSVDGKLDSVDGKLESMDGKLDKLDVIEAELNAQTGALEEQVGVLREIRDAV